MIYAFRLCVSTIRISRRGVKLQKSFCNTHNTGGFIISNDVLKYVPIYSVCHCYKDVYSYLRPLIAKQRMGYRKKNICFNTDITHHNNIRILTSLLIEYTRSRGVVGIHI